MPSQLQVFNRQPGYDYSICRHHSYSYDVNYEGLNQPFIGGQNGDFLLGYVSVLLRYELTGYAWGKALIESPRFLREFNRQLFDEISESTLISALK